MLMLYTGSLQSEDAHIFGSEAVYAVCQLSACAMQGTQQTIQRCGNAIDTAVSNRGLAKQPVWIIAVAPKIQCEQVGICFIALSKLIGVARL